MKTRAPLAMLLLCLSGLTSLGCAANPQGRAALASGAEQLDGKPSQSKRRFVIAPVSFAGFTVDGRAEQDWLATQADADRNQWSADKQRLASDLSELMYDDQASFDAGTAAAGPGVVVQLRLVSCVDGVFQLAVTMTDEVGRVVPGPSLSVTTRGGASSQLRLGQHSFLLPAASAVAQAVTRHGASRGERAAQVGQKLGEDVGLGL